MSGLGRLGGLQDGGSGRDDRELTRGGGSAGRCYRLKAGLES